MRAKKQERSLREIAQSLENISDALRRSTHTGGVTAEMLIGWANNVEQASMEIETIIRRLTWDETKTDAYRER